MPKGITPTWPAGGLGEISLAERINALLPQTQCTRCGYPDCGAYAEAIASDGAAINRCPPGGAQGVRRLATVTDREIIGLDTQRGIEGPRHVAVIDEAWCIGCTLCLPVCPTDAIIGSNKRMHAVLEKYCTGCELCIPVCPVDCISLVNVTGEKSGWEAWSNDQARQASSRYKLHQLRQLREAASPAKSPSKEVGFSPETSTTHSGQDEALETQSKRTIIETALAKARSRRGQGE